MGVVEVENLEAGTKSTAVPVRIVRDPGAVVPEYGYFGADAGCDLSVQDTADIAPHTGVDLRTGLRIQLPPGFYARITARSSTLRKRGLVISEGIIDQGYRGPLFVYAYNPSDKRIRVERGDRLAQLILAPIVVAIFEEVDEIDESERGARGFGSTGQGAWAR